jgi:class 3 adenylate cyclase
MPKARSTTITFLFTDIEGSTRLLKQLRERYGETLTQHQRLLREAFGAHGGRELDTQGDAFFVAFDRAKDAVLAAAAAQQALASHSWPDGTPVRVRIGIHTGEAVVSGEKYVGLAVHRAARICAAARGGQVLVSQTTQNLLADEEDELPGLTLRDLGLEQLKDLDRPVRVYQLEGPRLAASFSEPRTTEAAEARDSRGIFVGRERELAELNSGLEDALASRGRLFLLVGEPGIGKSRLTDELITNARARGARVLVGRCWEAGGAPAYWPWVQSLRAYVRDADAETLRSQLHTSAADLAQIVPELRELLPSLPEPLLLESEAARFRLFDSTASFLRNASNAQPLVLVLDDLHAADEPSLLLLRFLAAELADTRILVVGTLRDVDPTVRDALEATLVELGRERVTRRLELSGLTERDVARFIGLATGAEPRPGVVAAIHQETEGNPLFVGEVVRLLIDENRLDQLDDATATTLAIPESVQEVIGRRLRHLSEECRRVLGLAAIFGREFAVEALERVSAVSEDELLDVLDEAVEERVVTDVPGAPGRLRFSHALIRDALYENLSPTRRLRLHRQVGEALEAHYARDLGPHLAELAHHFCAALPAGSADKAIQYARAAADRAVEQVAYEEAVRLYGSALALVEDDTVRCELLLAVGGAQARAGETPGSKETYRNAAELAERLGLSDHLARAALGYGGRILWEVARDDEHLVPLLERAIRALQDQDSTLRVRLLARLAGGPLRDSSFPPERKAALSKEALDMARRIGDPTTLAYALAGYITAQHAPSRTREQVELATELIEVATEAGDRERAVEGHEHRLVALLELGEVAQAKADLETMAKLAEELRQPSQHWYVAIDRAMLALLEGRLADAEELIPAALSVGERAQGWSAAVTYRLQLYVLRREQGRLHEIEELIQSHEYVKYSAWRCVLPNMLVELNQLAEAQTALDALAADDFASLPFDEAWLVNMTVLADTAKALGDTERAMVLYRLLLPYADRVAVTYSEMATGSVSRYLGLLASTISQRDDAARHFEDAIVMNERTGARLWLAHTQEDYARMLFERDAPGDRKKAQALLSQALAEYRTLGMESYARRDALA